MSSTFLLFLIIWLDTPDSLLSLCNARSSHLLVQIKEKYIPTHSPPCLPYTTLLFRYPAAQSIALFSLGVELDSHTISTYCIYPGFSAFLI
jgi:hypothetical protein